MEKCFSSLMIFLSSNLSSSPRKDFYLERNERVDGREKLIATPRRETPK